MNKEKRMINKESFKNKMLEISNKDENWSSKQNKKL